MLSKMPSKKILLLAVILSGASLCVALFSYFFPRGSIQGELVKTSKSEIASVEDGSGIGLPVRLKIPALNIDAPIEFSGVSSDGSMGVPKGPSNVSWFNLGPRPGTKGSAVIAGHFGWKNNIPAVFDNLHKIKKGDRIYVEDEKGAILSFIVRETKMYNKDEDATKIFSSSGKTFLNLITCSGDWNEVEKTRPNRLVVFSEFEGLISGSLPQTGFSEDDPNFLTTNSSRSNLVAGALSSFSGVGQGIFKKTDSYFDFMKNSVRSLFKKAVDF